MAKRKSQWRPAAVAWRVLFGHNGPTKKAMRKAWREWTGVHASVRFDVDKGKVVTGGRLKQKPDGTFVFAPTGTRKRASAKQRIADMQTRVAKESDRHAAAQAGRPKPMAERVQRKTDGTFNGSTKATSERKAEREAQAAYVRAVKSAAASERRIRRDLGH